MNFKQYILNCKPSNYKFNFVSVPLHTYYIIMEWVKMENKKTGKTLKQCFDEYEKTKYKPKQQNTLFYISVFDMLRPKQQNNKNNGFNNNYKNY